MKSFRFAPRILLSAFTALTAPLLLCAAAHAADPIRIGSVLSITGPASFIGDPEAKTMKMYVDQINAGGGVIGRQIELVTYDDAGDANKARTFAARLTERDNIAVLVGGSTTGTTMAMIPVMESAQIPFMSLAGSVNIIEPVRKKGLAALLDSWEPLNAELPEIDDLPPAPKDIF